MTQEASMIEKIKVILKGIDQTEIESADGWWETSTGAKFGAEALKQILELLAQTQEPVACEHKRTSIWTEDQTGHCNDCGASGRMRFIADTTPPQRTWVGLTDEEIFETHKQVDSMQYLTFAKAIEAKLKEKNT